MFDGDGDKCIGFKLYGVLSFDPKIICVPSFYDGMSENPTEKVECSGFSTLPFYSNSIIQLFGQGGIFNALVQTGFSSAIGYSIPSQSGVVNDRSIALRGGQALSSVIDVDLNAKIARGGTINGDIATNNQEIYFKTMGLRREYAEKIDKFFDMYGYAVNTIKAPNVNVRPYWWFTKTRDCVIKGALPAGVSSKICDIFNKGVRFWKNVGGVIDVGNYQHDNTV